MGRFKGANTAKISEKGQKCADGDHLLEINRITYSDSGANGDYFVVEFTVKETNSTDKPGDQRVWTQSMEKKAFPFGKLLAFSYAAFGYDAKNAADTKEWDSKVGADGFEDLLEALCDESDPLSIKGRLVKATTKGITSNGFPFVAYTFRPGQDTKHPLP